MALGIGTPQVHKRSLVRSWRTVRSTHRVPAPWRLVLQARFTRHNHTHPESFREVLGQREMKGCPEGHPIKFRESLNLIKITKVDQNVKKIVIHCIAQVFPNLCDSQMSFKGILYLDNLPRKKFLKPFYVFMIYDNEVILRFLLQHILKIDFKSSL